MSLRLRLAVGIAVVVAVSLGLLGFAVVTSTRNDLLAATRRQLESSVFNRVHAAPPPPGANDSLVDPRGRATAHLVVRGDGQIIVSEPAGPPSNPTPLPQLDATSVAALRSGRSVTVNSVDGSLRYMVLGATTADGRLEIEAAPLAGIDQTTSSLIKRFVVGALITLLLAVLAVVIVLRNGLRPLRSVIDTADAVASGEREQRIPTDDGPTEIRRLSGALDRMLQQQRASLTEREQSEARLRRFVSDASHELQTPITSVLGWTQLHRKGALDTVGQAEAMARIESEGRRMAVLVDDLLLLARLDEHPSWALRPTDLSAVAHDAATDARAGDPNRPITCDAPTPVVVAGDTDRLRQVVDNLLRNVRVHTPPGTPATVTVLSDGVTASLTVEDDGPGIDPRHLDSVFDRFWRRDPSRTRATGGAGLGLAIVSALVEAHAGTVRAANRSGGGAVFTVTLPLARIATSSPADYDKMDTVNEEDDDER
jgi:two-component system, OmpR family, sensor kinase